MVGASRDVDVIINARSGKQSLEAAVQRVSSQLSLSGMKVSMHVVRTAEQLRAAVAGISTSAASVVVAAGGDGTIAAVASGVVGTSKTLAVLPLGTFNFFAQRVGVPLDVDAALDVLVNATATRDVSVGEVNGRIFLNNSSVGIYPTALKKREAAYGQFGRSQVTAYLSAAWVLARPPGPHYLQLTVDGTPLERRTPLLFVGVNPHQIASYELPGDECPADDRMTIYLTPPMAPRQLWALAARALARGIRGTDPLEVLCARELQVTLRRTRVRTALDGEIARLHSPLRYRILPNALRVLTP